MIMKFFALIIAMAFALPDAWAAGQSSASYKIKSDTFNSGVSDMRSASYRLSSSLGESFFNGSMASASYAVTLGSISQVDIPLLQVSPASQSFASLCVATSPTQDVTVSNHAAAHCGTEFSVRPGWTKRTDSTVLRR